MLVAVALYLGTIDKYQRRRVKNLTDNVALL